MLSWAITFLLIAAIAAVVGLSGVITTSAHIVWIVFAAFIVLFILSFFVGRKGPKSLP